MTAMATTASARAAAASALTRAIERSDFFRRGACAESAGVHREWFHFSLARPELTLITNFSVVDDPHQASAELFRVVVLARDREGWTGDCEEPPAADCAVGGGQIAAVLGSHSLALEHGCFRIAGRLEQRALAYQLELSPRAYPLLVNNVPLGGGSAPISWLAIPRLSANGWVQIGERRHQVRDQLVYHDHNWGHFSFRGLSWQWGHALPDAAHSPFCFVFGRLLNRAHSACFLQSLSVWKHDHPLRIFRDHELTVQSSGRLRSRGLCVPAGASLLADGALVDLPACLELRAQRKDDVLEATFRALDTARVVVPHEEDLETTVIHEVLGTLHVEGRIAGERVRFDGHGVFEFLGAGR